MNLIKKIVNLRGRFWVTIFKKRLIKISYFIFYCIRISYFFIIDYNWINLLLLLIPYHMKKANFITQVILEIKLAHYLSSIWACPGLSNHTHLKQPTNTCCFHGSLLTSKNSTAYLNFFVRYCSLKNPALWLALRFFYHNSRTRFFPNMLLLQKVKKPLTLSY